MYPLRHRLLVLARHVEIAPLRGITFRVPSRFMGVLSTELVAAVGVALLTRTLNRIPPLWSRVRYFTARCPIAAPPFGHVHTVFPRAPSVARGIQAYIGGAWWSHPSGSAIASYLKSCVAKPGIASVCCAHTSLPPHSVSLPAQPAPLLHVAAYTHSARAWVVGCVFAGHKADRGGCGTGFDEQPGDSHSIPHLSVARRIPVG